MGGASPIRRRRAENHRGLVQARPVAADRLHRRLRARAAAMCSRPSAAARSPPAIARDRHRQAARNACGLAAAVPPEGVGGGAGRSRLRPVDLATLLKRAHERPARPSPHVPGRLSGQAPAQAVPGGSGFAASGSRPDAWMVCPPAWRDDRTAASRLLHRGAVLQGARHLVSGVQHSGITVRSPHHPPATIANGPLPAPVGRIGRQP
jgi:hypothetical protein